MRKYTAILVVALAIFAVPAMAGRVASVPITHPEIPVYQAYACDSAAVPGVLEICPGTNWSNFVTSTAPYTIKNVVLRKQTPPIIQCADVFPVKTISQQGTPNIRLWWPLMYEVPGTTWTLTILYGTTTAVDDDGPGPNPPAYVHTEVWTWRVDATLQSLQTLMALFHALPFGLDEVPLISDEVLYPVLQQKITDVIAFLEAQDTVNASLLLGDFEMEVMDACIAVSPAFPNPTGPGTGIANSFENPACCKILADVEFIGFDLGILQPGK